MIIEAPKRRFFAFLYAFLVVPATAVVSTYSYLFLRYGILGGAFSNEHIYIFFMAFITFGVALIVTLVHSALIMYTLSINEYGIGFSQRYPGKKPSKEVFIDFKDILAFCRVRSVEYRKFKHPRTLMNINAEYRGTARQALFFEKDCEIYLITFNANSSFLKKLETELEKIKDEDE